MAKEQRGKAWIYMNGIKGVSSILHPVSQHRTKIEDTPLMIKKCLVRALKQTITPDITYPGCQGNLNNKDKTHHNQKEQNIFHGSYSTWSGAIELDYHASPVFSLKVKVKIQPKQNSY